MTAPADFDFFMGNWRVDHRRLVTRLAGSNEWQEFPGECRAWGVMGGFGNVDDNVLHIPSGTYRAVTARSFDPASKQWAIWWLDGRAPHVMDVPVKGSFDGDVGTFLAKDTFAGKPILVRFRWFKSRIGKPRWEQAFSPDDGASWEVNWTMDFARTGA